MHLLYFLLYEKAGAKISRIVDLLPVKLLNFKYGGVFFFFNLQQCSGLVLICLILMLSVITFYSVFSRNNLWNIFV